MAMGPTRFCESTAFPGCFPDGKWRPPEDENSGPDPIAREKLAQAPPVAPDLKAGDAVLTDSTTWHGGGGNVSSVNPVHDFRGVQGTWGDVPQGGAYEAGRPNKLK